MSTVVFEDGAINVDATVIAEAFAIAPARLRHLMRAAKITSKCERGVDEDAGRYRLNFFYGRRHLRLLVDETGQIIERSITEREDSR